MRAVFPLVLLVACGSLPNSQSKPTRPSVTPGIPPDPPVPPVPPTVLADCVPDPDNVLRFECRVEVEPPGPAEISFYATDGTGMSQTHSSGEALETHQIGLYFMTPSTDYTWSASPTGHPDIFVAGEVETGVPPLDADVFALGSGLSSADAFLMISPCGSGIPIVVDSAGTLLWYETLADNTFMDAASHTEDDTIIFMKGSFIVHKTWMGEELFRLDPSEERPHHDVFRKDGLNYVLFKETVSLYDRVYELDGFLIFDDSGAILAEWHLIDHFVPVDDPLLPGGFGVIDYSHANSIFVQDDGDILLSFRHLSAIAKINGDLSDPEFGEIVWRLSGDPDNLDFGSDFTLTSSAGMSADFFQQHNFHQRPDGKFGLFDNRISETARVSLLSIDEAEMTANIERTWDTGQSCTFQGSAWSTSTGNPIGVCAPNRVAMEFDGGGYPWALYSLTVGCNSGPSTYIPRFVPLDLY